MVKDFGIEIEFARLRKGVQGNAFQFFQGDVIVLNEKYDIVEVGVEAAVQLAERNAVWVGNEDLQVSKLTNADFAPLASSWQWNKPFDGNRLNVDFQFPGNLHDGLV